jgi:iron complex outermembrane receptor protein
MATMQPAILQPWQMQYTYRLTIIYCSVVVSLWLGGALAGGAPGTEEALDDPSDQRFAALSSDLLTYKKMSLDELMDQVVTSVSRRPEPYLSAPAALSVIRQNDIRRSGATSFPEALRLASNLQVAQAASSTWRISARGFNISTANKLLVLTDGRSIYSPLFSGVIWNMQDYLLEDIDRIEVISGPGGTLWGANAVNGVINIVSRDARDTQGVYAEAGAGTWLQNFVGARYGMTLTTNVFLRVYGKYFERGALEFADGKDAQDDWERGQGGFRMDAHLEENVFTLQGDIFGGGNDVVPGGQGTPQARGRSSGGNILGRWTHAFSEESEMSLQMYYDRVQLRAPFQGAGAIPPGTLKDDLDTYDIDFQHRFQAGDRQEFVWGLGYRFTHDVTESAPLVAFFPERLDRSLFSGFLQDKIRIVDDVFLTLGTKLEHNDYTGFEYEPNARLQWHPAERQMIWGAISRAVRMPSRFDRDLFQPNPAFGELLGGNDTFQSETVIAYELGYRAGFLTKVSGSISAFYNDYDRVRSFNLTDGGLPLVFENNLDVRTYGFELGLDYQMLTWWRLHAGYTLLEEEITVGPGGDLADGIGETSDPNHQVVARSSMDLPWNLEFDAIFRWVDQVRVNNLNTAAFISDYAELDLRLGWRPTRNLEISIVGQNLLHDNHVETGFPGPTQEQVGRSVYGKVALRF